MTQERIALGPLSPATPDEVAAAGTLAEAKGLRWDGDPAAPHLSVAPGHAALLAASATAPAVLVQAFDLPSTGATAADTLLLTDRDVRLASAPGTVLLALPGSPDTTRRAQIARVLPRLALLAVTKGAAPGAPDVLVAVRVDASGARVARLFSVPRTPRLGVDEATVTAERTKTPAGFVVVRAAWRLEGGSIGPMGPPLAMALNPDTTKSLHVFADAFEGTDVYNEAIACGVRSLCLFASVPIRQEVALVLHNAQADNYGPVYLVAEQGVDVLARGAATGQNVVVWKYTEDFTADKIASGESGREGHLLYEGLAAGAAAVHGGRLLLGDLVRTAPPPDAFDYVHEARMTRADPTDKEIFAQVDIRGPRGLVRITGPVRYVPNGSAITLRGVWFGAYAGMPAYPDARAERLVIRIPDDGLLGPQGHFFALTPSATAAVAVHRGFVSGLTVSTGEPLVYVSPEDTENPVWVDALQDTLPGAVAVSTTGQPYDLSTTALERVGPSSQRVLAFAGVAEATSEGQYGQYPVLVGGTESVYALSFGEGGIEASSPITERFGVATRQAMVPAPGGGVAMVTTTGEIRLLSPMPDARALSWPVAPVLNGRVPHALATYERPAGKGRDLVAAVAASGEMPALLLCYDAERGRWWTASGEDGDDVRTFYDGAPSAALRAVTNTAATATLFTGVAVARPWAVETSLFGLGDPYTIKRVRRVTLRQRPAFDRIEARLLAEGQASGSRIEVGAAELMPDEDGGPVPDGTFATPRALAYRFALRVEGEDAAEGGASLYAFEVRYEPRRPDRPKH